MFLQGGPSTRAHRAMISPSIVSDVNSKLPEPSHAELSQCTPGGEASWHVDTEIEHARATGERVHGNSQLSRALDAPICQTPRPLVHP